MKSGQDLKDCTNVEHVGHAARQKQTHKLYKINKIKLLHFKLLADLLATITVAKKQKNITTGRQQIGLNVFDLQYILRRKKCHQKYIL